MSAATRSAASAAAELSRVAAGIRAEDPAALYSYGVGVESLQSRVVGDGTRSLTLLMAGVLLVLLIACANIAGLSLARATARTQEVAVRMALGASASRVALHSLIEVLVLAATDPAQPYGASLPWPAIPPDRAGGRLARAAGAHVVGNEMCNS